MSKAMPKISKYMTTLPQSISSESSVDEAVQIMDKARVRHLPVMKNQKVLGIISDRDIKSIFAFAGADPKIIKVGDICSDYPYMTQPDALINEVATEMAAKKFGSALVLDNGKLVGIFTATDACQALSDICEQRFHN